MQYSEDQGPERSIKLTTQAVRFAVYLVLALALLAALVYLLDPWIGFHEEWFYLALLNTAPLLLPLLAIVVVFRRVWPSAILVGYFAWLLFVINNIKLAELGQPLLFTDILLLRQVVGNVHLLGLYVQPWFLAGVTLLAVFMTAVATWLERPAGGWSNTIALLVLSGLLTVLIVSGPVNRVFAGRGALDTPWSPIASIKETGLIASLAASAGRDVVVLPAVDQSLLTETIRRLSSAPVEERFSVAPEHRPDIVIVLSESFFDPHILGSIDPCIYLPDWCMLKASGVSGRMSIPTFGGNTTRTEFEILTGVPYALLPAGVYPYTSVVSKPMAGLPQWLRILGYETTAIHPHKRTFWQRHRAYPLLGFQQFIAEENMSGYSRAGWFISDQDMTDLIISQLQENAENPQFVFAISMENHGPWDRARPNVDAERLHAIPVPQALDEIEALAWQQYIYHAQNALAELNRLKQFVAERDRPSVIVFFGDHLPGLGPIYETLGFENGLGATEQQTPYLILGDLSSRGSDWSVEAAFQLPIKLLEFSGLPKPQRYQALAQSYRPVSEALPEGGRAALQLSLLEQSLSDWEKDLVTSD